MTVADNDPLREAMSRFASGVTVVTALRGEERFGITASSFTGVSMEPPLVLVCIARALHTHAAIESSRAFAVNILGVHQLEVARRFAEQWGLRFRGRPSNVSTHPADFLDPASRSSHVAVHRWAHPCRRASRLR